MAGIQHAIRTLSNACIEHGHVTTRILLPEQDIAGTRMLRLAVVPGTVGKISILPVATASGQGTRGNNMTYSIPPGYWTAHASYNAYDYHQTVQGYYNSYESSGKSRSAEVRVQYLAHRDQHTKTTAQARVSWRRSRNYMDGVELEVQRRDTSTFELSLMHQRNMGRALFDASVSFRNGVSWFGATGDLQPRAGGSPTNFYHALTADATLRIPFSIGTARLNASSSFRAQLTGDTLQGSEYFAIGGRYTVRGFDGRQTLGAEKGLTLRHDLGVALWRTGQTLYLALDGGHVTGPAGQYLPGSTLADCALGLRGGWKSFYYDTTVGCPLHKPGGLHTARITCTAQAGIQF